MESGLPNVEPSSGTGVTGEGSDTESGDKVRTVSYPTPSVDPSYSGRGPTVSDQSPRTRESPGIGHQRWSLSGPRDTQRVVPMVWTRPGPEGGRVGRRP